MKELQYKKENVVSVPIKKQVTIACHHRKQQHTYSEILIFYTVLELHSKLRNGRICLLTSKIAECLRMPRKAFVLLKVK